MDNKKEPGNERSNLSSLPERPIDRPDDDRLARNSFVARLCNALINETTKKSSGLIIGITGQWGSGKSSILNLLHQYIVQPGHYPDAIVVRFDPWLVSGRDDLIQQFLAELAGTIKGAPKASDKAKKLAQTISKYGAHLAPLANFATPGLGAVMGGSLKALENVLDRKQSLFQQRNELRKLLAEIEIPIVVIVDELDRIENQEIRAVAQLVRAVVDFPSISYVLGYDSRRVIEALADGDMERGRAYLEKIVQLQIPVPLVLPDELVELVIRDLEKLAVAGLIPPAWNENRRFRALLNILVPALVATPRDVVRLIGTFRALGGMVGGEVDWVDLLGFSTLLVKAPGTVTKISEEPELLCDVQVKASSLKKRFAFDKKPEDERLTEIIANVDYTESVVDLIKFLFPTAGGNFDRDTLHADALCRRRGLLTVLRLGILPGHYSREELVKLLASPQDVIKEALVRSYSLDCLGDFLERVQEVLPTIGEPHVSFWLALTVFLRAEDDQWFRNYAEGYQISDVASGVFDALVKQKIYSKALAERYFNAILESGDLALVTIILRDHLINYGCFGYAPSERTVFLSKDESQKITRVLSERFKAAHLATDWIKSLPHSVPLYLMIISGVWDKSCRLKLSAQLDEEELAIVKVCMLLFGGHYSVGHETIEALLGVDEFHRRVGEVLKRTAELRLNELEIYALKKSARLL